MSGVHELNTAFKCEVDQVRLRNVDPRRPVRTTCWKAAWEEHRGARWSAECVRLTQIRVLARILQVLLILTLREEQVSRLGSFISNKLELQEQKLVFIIEGIQIVYLDIFKLN